MIGRAIAELDRAIASIDDDAVGRFVAAIGQPGDRRLFLTGQGRSGLAAEFGAMRFMHLGFTTHVVGETTAPSVRSGDALIVVSGSGRTPVSVAFADIAVAEGADVLLVTHQVASPLAERAAVSIVIDCAHTEQFGGTLFEQAAALVLDSISHDVAAGVDDAYATMLHNHTNLQ